MQQTVLIIEQDALFAEKLKKAFEKSGYTVVEIVRNISTSIESIKKHKPNIITSELKYKNGSGIHIFEKIISHVTKENLSPTLVIISDFLCLSAKDYIRTQFENTHIQVLYFKKSEFSEKVLFAVLSISTDPLVENAEIAAEFITPAKTLSELIEKTVISYKISTKSKSFLYLVALIEYIILEDLKKIDIEDLYEAIGEEFGVGAEAVKKSIRRMLKKSFAMESNLNFSIEPKKFIIHIIREIKQQGNLKGLSRER